MPSKIQLLIIFSLYCLNSQAEHVSPALNGIQYPMGLKNWRVIGVSLRTDNDTQRVILGNNIAYKAANSNNTNPWPKGSVLAKLVWKNSQHPDWEGAIVPGKFIHSEIMIKDSKKYQSTGGWGYARWKGEAQQPYGNDSSFAAECFTCHTRVKKHDYVFTKPAKIP